MTVTTYEESCGLEIPEPATGTTDLAKVRALTLRYLVVSTILFAAGGLLGVLLRQSQADLDRISPNLWYEVMTAHGLATFVGWAAFALMGVTWWVLAECGLPIQGWGWRFAVACFWTMTVGATGVVVTTLGMGFAGSWVFLYPLPFHGGSWSLRATGIFSLAILSVGLSIFAYCFGVIAVVLGDGLGARSRRWNNRLGCALGFGYIWPKRFATERPVPFPVLPLTVIAIDMIIATIPLAVLLVEMVIQSLWSGVTVDPVLAKSMLWWFGHPVVYLLLFPAVAVYYHLIPRYAKRPLVAGHIIGIGWLIGVCANVVIGAHHMYLDFPNTFQQTVNIGMQPLTYAVTIPSALSLYSLSFTIYRSDFQWTPAARFLAVGMVSWLVAGLQGVGLATIQFDALAHNTLYAFVPRLTGRDWHSRRLADWHLVLTVVGGYGSVVPWMLQGLEGAPRRWAVLPQKYESLSQVALPFVLLIVIGQAIFFYNLARTIGWRSVSVSLGARLHADDTVNPTERPTEALGAVLAATGVAFALLCLASKPLVWAPLGILAGYTATTLGTRRQGWWAVLAAAVLMLVGLAGFRVPS
jgi:cytochrome c oxidase subunit I